jgi:hypothetical protein
VALGALDVVTHPSEAVMSKESAVRLLSVVLAVVVPLGGPVAGEDARPVNVSLRARLGNDLEAMTRLSADAVAVLDGYDVLAVQVPNTPPGKTAPANPKKLFDVRTLPTGAAVPRGFAYDTTRERFYFGPPTGGPAPTILVTDREGRRRPDITLKLLPGQVIPVQFESLAYLPPGIPRFGDRIAAVLIGEDLIGRISIIRLDGTVEYEIPVAPGSPTENYVTGMTFVPPDRFLFTPLTDTMSAIYQVDLGGMVSGPVLTGDARLGFEGIALLSGGRVAVIDYAAGWVFVNDARGARLPHQDRDLRIGAGISSADSIAWDSGASRLLVNAWVGGEGVPRHVHALAPPFTATTQITRDEAVPVELLAGIAYLPDTAEIAVTEGAGFSPTRGIWSFDAASGQYHSRLSLASFPPADFRPRRVTSLPGRQLAVRVVGRTDLIHLFSRDGAPDPADPSVVNPEFVGTVTLSVPQPVRSSLDFDQRTGRLLVGRQYYDLEGNARGPLTGIPSDFLGQNFVHVTSGPYAGQVAGFDGAASELVIFRP